MHLIGVAMTNKDTRRNSAILSPKIAGSNPVMPDVLCLRFWMVHDEDKARFEECGKSGRA